jgi:hypothetical protein
MKFSTLYVLALLWLTAVPLQAVLPALRRSGDDEWQTSLLFDYDTSRFRTNAWHFGSEIQWGSWDRWIQLELDTFSSFQNAWNLRSDSYATLELGHALHRDKDRQIYINGKLRVDAHSQLSRYGGDVTPQVEIVWGINDDLWMGADIGAVLATAPEEDVKRGYLSGNVWIAWLCGWQEDDSLSLNVWAAGNEIPQDDKVLFIEMEYSFALSESLQATVGLGTDPISPWDTLGIWGTAGLQWFF